jgi:hypothetical protein
LIQSSSFGDQSFQRAKESSNKPKPVDTGHPVRQFEKVMSGPQSKIRNFNPG